MYRPYTENNKLFLNSFLLAFGYGIGFHLLLYFLFQREILPHLPGYSNGLPFDAAWYEEIVRRGYKYYNGAQSNAAFFPMLPLIWKLSHLGPRGMGVLNLIFFSAGFAIFNLLYKLDSQARFLLLTIPSIYFVWVPYTEALFILFNTIFLFGLIKNKRWIMWAGLFFVSLTRPTTMVLAPALFIMELLANEKRNLFHAMGVFLINYAIPLLTGLGLFIFYQYYATGVWFAFFKQEVNWGHEFAWPTFPLSNYHGFKLLWLNAIAMFIGLISLIILLKSGVKWLVKNKSETDKPFVLSCLYITGVTLVTLLFNPIWGSNTTNVFDIHRYVFVSPFFWIFFSRVLMVNTAYRPVHYMAVFVLTNLFWLLFAHYRSLELMLYFNTTGVYMVMFMLLSDKRVKWVVPTIAAINLILQVNMHQWFFSNIYPG
jgi:hypothetical protein